MSERNQRKVYTGRVVSDKMDKTITVVVETYKKHSLYGKRVKYSKKFKAHDEQNEAKLAISFGSWKHVRFSYKTFSFSRSCRKSSYYLIVRKAFIPKGGYTDDSTGNTFKSC